jgi:hypothetical protein
LCCQIANYAFSVSSAFRYIFDKRGFYFVAEFGFDLFACRIVGISPACVADRANIDEADF